MTEDLIRISVRDYIATELADGVNLDELAYDLRLIDAGVLQSMDVIRLLGHLEDSYDFSIQPEDFRRENIATIDAIARFVKQRIG
ncbi:MAG: acyl carrier protein [Myxococcales bacterium]|nr:acyl carrier protein [Myxococcales bacterium]